MKHRPVATSTQTRQHTLQHLASSGTACLHIAYVLAHCLAGTPPAGQVACHVSPEDDEITSITWKK